MRVSRVLSAGMTIACKRLEAGERIPWHDHGKPTLCVVYAGIVEEQDTRQRRDRTAGDLVFRPEPQRHRNFVRASSSRVLTLEIEPRALDALHEMGLPAGGTVYCPRAPAVRFARAAECALVASDPTAELELTGIGYELLAITSRHTPRPELPPPWLLRVRDRLASDLATTPTLSGLADDARVSPDRLARAFRRHFGASVAAYLRTARLDRALQLLVETDLPLLDVALEAGFYDQSHLTNVVRQQTGFTPAEFRRRRR